MPTRPLGFYTVMVHQAPEGGYWAEVLELPGCYSSAENLEELRENIREAIALVEEVEQEDLAEAIKLYRAEHQLSTASFAGLVGCSPRAVTYWESRGRVPRGIYVPALRRVLASIPRTHAQRRRPRKKAA